MRHRAFTQDLTALLVNTNSWVNQPAATASKIVTAIQGAGYYPYLKLALQLSVEIQRGEHAGDIIHHLAAEDYTNITVWGIYVRLRISLIISIL